MNASNGGAGYLGQTNWQLPPADTSCSGYNCSSGQSPLGELFNNQMGLSRGNSGVDQSVSVSLGRHSRLSRKRRRFRA